MAASVGSIHGTEASNKVVEAHVYLSESTVKTSYAAKLNPEPCSYVAHKVCKSINVIEVRGNDLSSQPNIKKVVQAATHLFSALRKLAHYAQMSTKVDEYSAQLALYKSAEAAYTKMSKETKLTVTPHPSLEPLMQYVLPQHPNK